MLLSGTWQACAQAPLALSHMSAFAWLHQGAARQGWGGKPLEGYPHCLHTLHADLVQINGEVEPSQLPEGLDTGSFSCLSFLSPPAHDDTCTLSLKPITTNLVLFSKYEQCISEKQTIHYY